MPTKGRTFKKKDTEYVQCPKCGRFAWKPRKVRLRGKGGAVYWYLRYRHPLYRHRSDEHYVRIAEEPIKPRRVGVQAHKGQPATLEEAVEEVEAKRGKKAKA